VRSRQQGFTLLEVIIASGILAMVFLIASTGLLVVNKTWTKSMARSEKLKNLLLIDRVVDSNFRHVVPFEWKRDNFRKQQIFLGDRDRFTAAVKHRITHPEAGAFRFLSIYVEESKLVAEYRQRPTLFWNDQAQDKSREIIGKDIDTISFLYARMGKKGIEWVDDWDEKKEESSPLAIQMTVNWEDGESEIWLRRTAASSLRENYGVRKTIGR